jgi:leader peptidase (prepilin peptidase)/N-methyltransferase
VIGLLDAPAAEFLLSPVALALLGLCVGSFLNVVIHRLPLMMEREWWGEMGHMLGEPSAWPRAFGSGSQAPASIAQAGRDIASTASTLPPLSLARPRSRCPACGHVLAWHENIPLLGWLRLRGRCSACGTRISARYPAVELLTGVLFAAAALRFGVSAATLVWCVAFALLVAAAFIDLDTTLLPDDLTLPLLGLGLLAAGLGWSGVPLHAAAWGALGGYASLWAVSFVYSRVRGVAGMGEGDFKLLAGLGALLGWQALPSVILLASVVGAAVGLGLIVFKQHGRDVPIPFGPYLAGGGVAAAFFGPQLTSLLWPVL